MKCVVSLLGARRRSGLQDRNAGADAPSGDRYHHRVSPSTVLPLVLAGIVTVVFVVLIALGRPKGFVRIASAVSGVSVLALGLTTLGLWLGGSLG